MCMVCRWFCAGLLADGPASAPGGRPRDGRRNATEHRDNAAEEEARNTGERDQVCRRCVSMTAAR